MKVKIIQNGTIKEVSQRDAKILVALKKATLATETPKQVEAQPLEQAESKEATAKRAYRRKDIQAEGT